MNRTGSQFLSDLWAERHPLRPGFRKSCSVPPLRELQEGQWSPEFERLMRNRLIMGAFRYGLISEQKKRANGGGKRYDVVRAVGDKVRLYEETGNTEHIVDAANYCLLVFELDPHPRKHFSAHDDAGGHCQIKNDKKKEKEQPK